MKMIKYLSTYITATLFFVALTTTAQTPTTIVKDGNYTVSGSASLLATKSITLKPDTWIQSGSTFSAIIAPDAYIEPVLSVDENYVFTRVYQKGMSSSSGITENSDVIESITYFDGLGRPKQQIAIKASPEVQDIVTHIAYDDYGRQDKQYLPYKSTLTPGEYKTVDVVDDIQQYYKDKYTPDFGAISVTEVNAYSESIFEPSPLNRVKKQAAPGADWKATELRDDHTIKFDWDTNQAGEVVYFKVNFHMDNTEIPILVQDQYYPASELYVTIIKDENWTSNQLHSNDHTTKEYKDKLGRVILKTTYDQNIPHDTYYVYDDFSNLTYVIPPKVDSSNGVDATELSELCYQYKYDNRNRLIEKKIPGKGWEYIVYNKLDQPVLSQDVNLRATNRWLYTKYDAFGRVAYTGKSWANYDREYTQDNINQFITTHYEQKLANPIMVANTTLYYSDDAYFGGDIEEIHTINYYDNYTFDHNVTNPGTVYRQTVDTNAKGLVTGTKVRVLDTNDWITTVTYYDDKGRSIYVHSTNTYLNTVDVVETKFDFAGKVLESKTTHTKGSNAPIVTTDVFTYDHMGRLLTQDQTITGQPTEQIVSNTYDELGQLERKEVGGGLQTIDYTYNIRGWLKQINNPDVMGNDLFAFGINYNTTTQGLNARTLYNGNISETIWKTANDNTERSYGYQYDALNRITAATSNDNYYNLSNLSYDKTGNIITLQREGAIVENPDYDNPNHFGSIDILGYNYDNGNKLLAVADSSASPLGFEDGNTGVDYTYDNNGNMIQDLNKKITSIQYNHLNLPVKVEIPEVKGEERGISYIYTATGSKIEKIIKQGGRKPNIISQYAGNYIYKNGTLQFMNHPEGYIEPDGSGGYDYIYQYKDHLGNIRLSYADDNNDGVITAATEIREEKNYYPFGLQHKGYNNTIVGRNHEYGFQEQEEQNELGLNWIQFKWRNHDPAIGRFMTIDPLTEEYMDWGPYVFSGNRVIDARELEGLEPHSVHKTLDGAAKNFGEQYNGISIRAGREVGTRFYSTTINGETTYSYTTPTMGTEGFVDPNNSEAIPDGTVQVGDGHTHGSDGNNEPFGMDENEAIQYGDNFPSDNDIDESDNSASTNSSFEADYTVTPNGTLLKYTPTGKTGDNRRSDVKKVNGASETIPSDTNSNTRKNNVSPNVTPEVLPNNVDKDDFSKQ